MPDINLMPITGMNTESEDKALRSAGDSPRHFVRDAVNVDVNAAGEIEIRPGARKVTGTGYKSLWQSPAAPGHLRHSGGPVGQGGSRQLEP